MSHENKISQIKKEIRSVIVSSPEAVTINKITRLYLETVGKPLPFLEFGFRSVEEFIKSMPDVVRIQHSPHGTFLVPVFNEQVAHINSLVLNQRKKKVTSSFLRRPRPRQDMIYPELEGESSCIQKVKKPAELVKGENVAAVVEKKLDDITKPSPNDPDNQMLAVRSSPSVTKSISPPTVKEEDLQSLDFSEDALHSEHISDQMRDNFRKLLQEHPKGFNSNKLIPLYKESFGCPLLVQDLGFSSLKELILSLPNIFTFEKNKFSNDWILFDARISPKKKVNRDPTTRWIPNCLLNNITNLASMYPSGIKLQDFLSALQKVYGIDVDVNKMGYDSFSSLLVNCNCVQVKLVEDECIVFPKSTINEEISLEKTNLENALPSVENMKSIWMDYFTSDVCDPTYSYKRYPLGSSKQMRVYVSDVHSPSAVWLQPVETASKLSTLMLELNKFYDDCEERYVAHENIIKPGLICCVQFHLDNRWYRSQIMEMGANNTVKVCYVDYGTVNYEKKSGIRLLHKQFAEETIQVLRGKLYNLQPIDGSGVWANEVNYFLFDILYSHTFFAQIIDVEETEPSVEIVLIDTRHLTDVNINDTLIEQNFATCTAICEVNPKQKENAFEEVMQNLLPIWISSLNPCGIDQLLEEIRLNVENNINHELHLCCSSHFIRSMFLTDPVDISSIWRKVIMKNTSFLYQQVLKEASNIVKLEGRFYNLQPFCDDFSTEMLDDDTLLEKNSDPSDFASLQRTTQPLTKFPVKTENVEDTKLRFLITRETRENIEEMSTPRVTHPRIVEDGSDFRSASRSSNCATPVSNSMKHSPFMGSEVTTPPSGKKGETKLSESLPRHPSLKKVSDKDTSEVENRKNLVFEADTALGIKIIFINLDQLYVVREQVVKDFARGIPTMLLHHRTKKLTDQLNHLNITNDTHPDVFNALTGYGWIMDKREIILMPLKNVGEFLRVIAPQHLANASMFDQFYRLLVQEINSTNEI